MRRPIAAAVIASTVFGTLVGLASVARADKRKVVVEQFSGPSSDRFRQSVVSALGKMVTVEVIADKKVANVEADLGVVEVSENYEGVAKALKATAFIGGTVTGKKPKARLVVHDGKGGVAGEYSWSAANPAKLIAAVNADVSEKLAGFLGAAGGGGSEAVAVAKKEERKPAKKEEVKEAKADEEPKAESARKRTAASEEKSSGDTEGTVSASADEPSGPVSSTGRSLTVAFVMRGFSRDFTYNQKVDTAQAVQGYNLQMAPAPGLAVEAFLHKSFALIGAFNYALVGSKDEAKAGRQSSVYKTTAYSWSLGAKGRFAAGSLGIEPDVAYGMQVFKVEDFGGNAANGIAVAGVDYKHIRAGGGVRIPISSASVLAGAHYLHILDAGQILSGKVDKNPMNTWFYGKAMGGDVFAELTVPLVKGFEGRLGLDYRRIVYSFDVKAGDPRVAGGATDSYLGINLALGYSIGL